ncbi:MAG: patatin-like phospholipase family protein [Bdellovibrionales bacterium]|nr:patatin-like phospholipase family protein [Bdellovibrionales bacterium]
MSVRPDYGNYLLQDLSEEIKNQSVINIVTVIQGGGAKGAWQGGFLEGLMDSNGIRIVASAGSSAGAINSYLVSEKIRFSRQKIFRNFWVCCWFNKIKGKRKALVGIIWASFIILGRQLFSIFKKTNRKESGLVIFKNYASLFKKILPEGPSEIYSYIHVTSNKSLPSTFMLEDHPMFMYSPGESSAELENESFSFTEAVALSCALPIVVQPYKSGDNAYGDGGIYANLPLGIIQKAGNIGANVVICICSTPIDCLDPEDFVENRMLNYLYQLKKLNTESLKSFLNEEVVYGALTLSKIFIVDPSTQLESGTIKGFLCRSTLSTEYDLGYQKGQDFAKMLEELKVGNKNNLANFLIVNKDVKKPPPIKKIPLWARIFAPSWK